MRHVDLVARYGGEEFAAILIDTDEAGALEVAERVRAGITHAQSGGGADTLSVSIGVATCPQDATFKDELVDKADWAMYLAKRRGRNKVMTFGAEHGGETPEQAAVVRPEPRRRHGRAGRGAGGVPSAATLGASPRSLSASARTTGVAAEDIHAAVTAAEAGDSGGDTPAAKIVEIAETYQALVTERPYRARISEAEALDELLRLPRAQRRGRPGARVRAGARALTPYAAQPRGPERRSISSRPSPGLQPQPASAPRPSGAVRRSGRSRGTRRRPCRRPRTPASGGGGTASGHRSRPSRRGAHTEQAPNPLPVLSPRVSPCPPRGFPWLQ